MAWWGCDVIRLVLVLCLVLTGCQMGFHESLFTRSGSPTGAPTLTLNQSSMALGLGEYLVLAATGAASTATLSWSSSNPAVAQVAGNGGITGVSIGTTTITAQTSDHSAYGSCSVTVYDMNQPVPLVGGGAITGTTMNLSGATMAVDPVDGSVYVAYVDNTSSGRVLKSAQGTGAWTAVGGSFATTSAILGDRSQNLSLAVNQGTPYVAYLESTAGFVSQVKRFDGSNWVTLAGTFVSNGAASYLSLGFDSSNRPFLGEIEAGTGQKPAVYLLTGTTWGSIGTGSIGFNNTNSSYSAVAYDATGLLAGSGTAAYFVAYQDGTQGGLVVNFPGAPNSFSTTGSPVFTDMTIANGILYVGYENQSGTAEIMVQRPQDTFGKIHPMGTDSANYTSVTADPRNGTAYLAFADSTSYPQIVEIRGGTSSGLPGTVIVSHPDYNVDSIKLAFFVDTGGHGHLYACYGLTSTSGGGVLVKDFAR